MLRSIIFALILCCCAAPAFAQGAAKTAPNASNAGLTPGGQIKADPSELAAPVQQAPDIKKIPAIQNLLAGGAELYYLGERGGLTGFLIYKDGKIQVLYITADRQHMVFGALYSMDGVNLSSQQIEMASNSNTQLKGLLTAASEQQRNFEIAGSGSSRIPAVGKDGLPTGAPLSPGEQLYNDFQAAAGVIVGEADKPLLLMLVDPLCPHCRETWKQLRDSVAKGVLRVKLLPIGPSESDRESYAAMLLRTPAPLDIWNKFEDGDHSVLTGTPNPVDLAAVRATWDMAVKWKIVATPYLVYRGKDGKVKVVQGSPEKIATVLSDLGT